MSAKRSPRASAAKAGTRTDDRIQDKKPGPAGGGRKGRRGGPFRPVNPLALNHAVLVLIHEQGEAKRPKASEIDEFSGITRQHRRRLKPQATVHESEMRPSLVTVLRWCNWRRWTIDDLKDYFEECGLLPCGAG